MIELVAPNRNKYVRLPATVERADPIVSMVLKVAVK